MTWAALRHTRGQGPKLLHGPCTAGPHMLRSQHQPSDSPPPSPSSPSIRTSCQSSQNTFPRVANFYLVLSPWVMGTSSGIFRNIIPNNFVRKSHVIRQPPSDAPQLISICSDPHPTLPRSQTSEGSDETFRPQTQKARILPALCPGLQKLCSLIVHFFLPQSDFQHH